MCHFLCANRLNLSVFSSFPSQKKLLCHKKRLSKKKKIISLKCVKNMIIYCFVCQMSTFSYFSFFILVFFVFDARQTANVANLLISYQLKRFYFFFSKFLSFEIFKNEKINNNKILHILWYAL